MEKEKEYDCLICLRLAEEDPHCCECGILLCGPCVKELNKYQPTRCPLCREITKFTKAHKFIVKVIGNLPKVCKCGHKTTVSEYKVHIKKCKLHLE